MIRTLPLTMTAALTLWAAPAAACLFPGAGSDPVGTSCEDASGDPANERPGSKLPPPLDDAFGRLDADGDGLVTEREISQGAGVLVRVLDANRDGALSGEDLPPASRRGTPAHGVTDEDLAPLPPDQPGR